MRVNIKQASLIAGAIAIVLWFVVTSICIVDLYATQGDIIDEVVLLHNSLADLYDYVLEPFNTTQVSLSDETKELVEDLRWKHSGLSLTDNSILYYSDFEYEWWNISFEDGMLTIKTQDDTWFIEMQRKEE